MFCNINKLALIALLSAPLGVVAGSWIIGSGQSCKSACAAHNGMQAVTSGMFKNGRYFYVCSANAEREGPRPGYNLEPHWSKVCTVSWQGKEKAFPIYKCLCQ